MAEYNSPSPHYIKQFTLNKISTVKCSFIGYIKERELMSKRLSKYVDSFDHFDKSLIVLLVTTGSISIASFAIEKSVRDNAKWKEKSY